LPGEGGIYLKEEQSEAEGNILVKEVADLPNKRSSLSQTKIIIVILVEQRLCNKSTVQLHVKLRIL